MLQEVVLEDTHFSKRPSRKWMEESSVRAQSSELPILKSFQEFQRALYSWIFRDNSTDTSFIFRRICSKRLMFSMASWRQSWFWGFRKKAASCHWPPFWPGVIRVVGVLNKEWHSWAFIYPVSQGKLNSVALMWVRVFALLRSFSLSSPNTLFTQQPDCTMPQALLGPRIIEGGQNWSEMATCCCTRLQ